MGGCMRYRIEAEALDDHSAEYLRDKIESMPFVRLTAYDPEGDPDAGGVSDTA